MDGHQCAGTLSVANLVHDGYQLDVSARVSWVRVADPLGERNEGLPRGFVFSTASYSYVFTFSRVEFWVNISRLSSPAIDRPTLGLRGATPGSVPISFFLFLVTVPLH